MSNIETIKNSLTPVFARHNVKRAVLFGSYAKGTANERSDVDWKMLLQSLMFRLI